MDEVLDDAGPGELLKVQARFAQLGAHALHLADVEPLADQVVQADATHHDLAAGLRAGQAGVLDGLGLDQRQRGPGLRAIGEVVPVPLQPLAGHGANRTDRGERFARTDVDGLHVHVLHDPC
ncbi:MAG: hypothetical protein JO345_39480 [Streptosporangiaceae bacterium]|nr:hypothetical protein [Streptosporangiaceae bacterium]